MINIQILNCHGIFGHWSVIFRPQKATISWTIKYLNIFCTKKWCIQKTCITMRRLTFHSPIYDPMNTGGVASKIVRESCENRRFQHISHSASINIHLKGNLRTGGDSTYNSASFSHALLFGGINGQLFNCPRSFNEVFWFLPRETAVVGT